MAPRKKIIRKSLLDIEGLEVHVVRKAIKNLYVSVRPPDGQVRVSAPLAVADDFIIAMVRSRLLWIEEKQSFIKDQSIKTPFTMGQDEIHYLFGKQCSLEVVERSGKHGICLRDESTLVLSVHPGTSVENRLLVLNAWYRSLLHDRITVLLDVWQERIGVEVSSWGIKRMKSKWGSCNITRKRIWLSLELAKRPVECLECVVVHELVHLLERCHNARFYQLMDTFLPTWRSSHDALRRDGLGDDFLEDR